MLRTHYRLSFLLAASLSLAVAGCGSNAADDPPATAAGRPPPKADVGGMDTDATLWSMLGLAKESTEEVSGPHLGPDVSPSLWQAAHDSLGFVKITSQDPAHGMLETDWYSPPGKPDERMRIGVYIRSVALRLDSFSVAIEREVRPPGGGPWQKSTIAREVVDDITNTILLRARHLHAEQFRSMM